MMKRRALVFLILLFGIQGSLIQAAQWDAGWSMLDIHGFISQGFLKSWENNFYADTKEGTFQFNEFGINFATELTDRLRVGMQLLSRDLGDFSNNTIELDWGYADYRWRDWFGIRVGKIKIPYGLYNETRDVDMLRTSIFLPISVYPETARETAEALQGIGAYGTFDLKSWGFISYQLQYGNINLSMDDSFKTFMEDQANADIVSLETSQASNLYLEWNTPLDGLRVAGDLTALDIENIYQTRTSSLWGIEGLPVGTQILYKMKNTRIYTCSAEYTWGNLVLMAEYMRFLTDVPLDEDWEGQEGYYGGVSYRFSDWGELGAYYAVFYGDINDKKGKKNELQGRSDYLAWQKEFVLTTRVDVNSQWTFKVEGHVTNGATFMLNRENPEGFAEDSFLLAVKTTFNF